jgi:hypothetical protein
MQPAVQLPITSACRARHGYSKAVCSVPTTFTAGVPHWNELCGNRVITKIDTQQLCMFMTTYGTVEVQLHGLTPAMEADEW